MSSKILLRRGTAAQWSSANPILGIGELGIETDTLKIKIGNGTSTWTQLTSYANVTPAQLTSEINNLISAAPATLDTLNELAAAINNDASFSTTVNNLLTGKVSKSGGDTITSSTESTIGLIVKATTSQTANILEIQNPTSGVIFAVSPSAEVISYRRFSVVSPSASTIGTIIKGAASQTAALQEWQNSAGTVLSNINNVGAANFVRVGIGGLTPGTTPLFVTSPSSAYIATIIRAASGQTANILEFQSSAGGLYSRFDSAGQYQGVYAVLSSDAVGTLPLKVKGASGQTANLTEWQNSAGTVLTKVDANGVITITNTSGAGAIFQANGAGGGYFSVGPYGGISTNGGLSSIGGSSSFGGYGGTSNVVVTVKGASGQTGDLQQWTNFAGTVLTRVKSNGNLIVNPNGFNFIENTIPALKINSNTAQNAAEEVLLRLHRSGVSATTYGGSVDFNLSQWQATNSGTGYVPYTQLTIALKASASDNESANVNVLTLRDNSSVGINNTSPSAQLDVASISPSKIGLTVKGAASQTANLQEWQSSTGSVGAYVASDGSFITRGSLVGGSYSGSALFGVQNYSTTQVVAAVKGAASQTADLQQWQNSAGTSVVRLDPSGRISILVGSSDVMGTANATLALNTHATDAIGVVVRGVASQTGDLQQWRNSAGTVNAKIAPNGDFTNNGIFTVYGRFGGASFTDAAALRVNGYSTSVTTAIIKAVASQTANLQEWQNSAGTTLLSISPDGYLNKTGTVYIGPTLQFADPGVGNETKFIFTKSTDGAYLTVKERASDQTFYEFGMNDNALDGGDYFQWANGQWSGPGYGWMPLQLGSNSGKNQTLRFVGEQSIFWSPVSTPVNSPYFTYLAENSASTNYEVSKWAPGNGSGTNIRRLESSGSTATFNIDISGYTYASRMGYRVTIDSGATTFSYTTYLGDNSSGSAIAINAGNWVTLSNGLKIRIGSGALAGENWSFLAFPTPRVGIGGATDTSALGIIRPSATDKGLIIKGAESQTANLQEWQNSSGTALVSVSSVGNFYVGNTFSNFGGQTINAGYVTIAGSLPSVKPLVIRGAASQTANLQEWQNSAGTVKARIDSNGNFVLESTLAYLGTTSAYVGVGASSGMRAHAGSASVVPWQVIGAASQTANLQEWQNSSGTVIARVQSDGAFVSDYITAGIYLTSLGKLRTGSASNYGAQLEVTPTVNTNIGAVVRGADSQSADLQQWQNSSAAVLAKVDSLGNITATNYNLSNSLYNIKKTLKKTIDPAQNAIAGNTYDLFQIAFSQSLQGIFTMQVSIRNGGYGQSMSYTLPVTYVMDWLSQYGITNPFTDSTTWVDLTPITFAPRHLMTNDYLKFQARVLNNTIFFRIKLTGQLTSNPLFDVYIQHSEEFANSTVTELSSTGTDFTTSGVLPNFLSSKAGTTAIFNPLTITSSVAANVPLTIKGTSSQSANLQQWQNSAAVSVAQISATGTISTKPVGFSGNLNTPIISVTDTGSTWSPGNFSFRSDSNGIPRFSFTGPNAANEALTINGGFVGVNTPSPISVFQVTSGSVGHTASIIKGAASQTANLTEWQNSAGTVLAKVEPTGIFNVNNFANSTLTTALVMDNSGVGTGTGTQIVFRYGGANYASISSIYSGSPTGADMVFNVGSTGAAKMRIDANGNVGINQLLPGQKLDVVGAGRFTAGAYAANQAVTHLEFVTGSPSSGFTHRIVGNTDSAGTPRLSFQAATNATGGSSEVLSIRNDVGSVYVTPYSLSSVGLIVKGFASQTANLQEWQNSAGTVQLKVAANGDLISGNNTFIGAAYGQIMVRGATDYGASVNINTGYLGTFGLIIRGQSSQTADLQQWQNSAGTVLAKVAADGQLSVGNGTSNYLSTYDAYGNITSRTAGTNYSANISVLTGATSYIGMVIRGQASQTANLQEWQNSAGDVVAALAINTEGGSQNATLKLQGAYGGIISNGEWSITRYGGDLQMLAPTNYLVRTVYAGSFIIRGAASQTANLQEWQNVGGTVLAKITASGALDVTAITVNGAAITSTPTTSDVELMNIMGAY